MPSCPRPALRFNHRRLLVAPGATGAAGATGVLRVGTMWAISGPSSRTANGSSVDRCPRSPDRAYLVTSGTHVNSGCCFDYGNSETDRRPDGGAAMDAIYFGTSCCRTVGFCPGTAR